jgi:molybdopterin converting factor small subunit
VKSARTRPQASGNLGRVRLGAGLARLSEAPLLTLDLDDGATVADLFERLGSVAPDVSRALPSVLPVVGGEHAERTRPLRPGDEVALLLPVSGG